VFYVQPFTEHEKEIWEVIIMSMSCTMYKQYLCTMCNTCTCKLEEQWFKNLKYQPMYVWKIKI
jgi:hypothetical protein